MQNQDFRFKPSRIYAIFIITLGLSTAVLSMTLSLPLGIKLAGCFIILLHTFLILRRYVLLQSPLSITSIRFQEKQTWLIAAEKESLAAELQGASVITSQIAILNFKCLGKWFPLTAIVLKDSLPPDKYRQLLVVLKMN